MRVVRSRPTPAYAWLTMNFLTIVFVRKRLCTKQRSEFESRAETLVAEGGITDPDLASQLSGLGIEVETLPVLHLVPLIQVAWADGEIQAGERALLNDAATTRGIIDGASKALFEQMLNAPPTEALVAGAMALIRHFLDAMSPEDAVSARADLFGLSKGVADASGGVFGLWGRIDAATRISHAL